MSSSNSAARKRDLIERVRYPNPIPAPPYPPKLLSIPTPASRLSHPSYSARLARNNALPLVVDAEVGMPLDLSRFPRLWAEQRYTSQGAGSGLTEDEMALHPSTLDPEDAFLLSDLAAPLAGASVPLSGAAAPLSASSAANASATATAANAVGGAKVNDVTWLRRTEYLTEEVSKARASAKARHTTSENIDSSRSAQLARIESTFVAAHSDLSSLRHPTKPNVTAVESFELLPDPDTWATRMSVFRFGDHPDGRTEADADLNIDDEAAEEASLQSRRRVEMGLLKPYSFERIGWYLPTYFDDDELEEDEAEDSQAEDGDEGGKKRKAKKGAYLEPSVRRAMERDNIERFGKKRRLGKPSHLQGPQDGEDGHAETNGDASSSDALSLVHVRDYAAHDVVQNQNQEVLVVFVDRDAQAGTGEIAREEDEVDASAAKAVAAGDEDDDDGLFGDDADEEAGDAGKQGKAKEAAPDGTKEGKLPIAVLKERAFKAASIKAGDAERGEQPRKVAYMHPVNMRAALRVRRKRPNERPPAGWFDVARVGHRALDEREAIDRLYYRAEVDDLREEELPERIVLEEPEEEDDAAGEAEAEGAEDADAEADADADEDTDGDEDEDEVDKARKPRRVVDDDDDDDKMVDAREEGRSKPRKVVDEDDDDEDDDEEKGGKKGKNRGQAEDSDDDDEDEDEDEDADGMSVDGDEELAALRAEAEGAGDGDDAAASGADEEGGRGGRNRRRRAANEDTIDSGEEE